MELTQARVRELFDYRDGLLFWKVRQASRTVVGSVAGWKDGKYQRVKVDGKTFRVHRIIFLMFHGWLPVEVDHKDTIKTNNHIENLRASTKPQNQSNRGKNKNNTSGYKGVNWHARQKKWHARIGVGSKRIYLGSFDTEESAAMAYAQAAMRYHGEFARVA